MTIAFRAKDSNSAADETVVVTKPTGVVDNDIMMADAYWRGTAAMAWPTGFTELDNFTNATDTMRHAYAWKRASSEGADYTFTATGASSIMVAIAAWSGVDTTTAIDVQGTKTTSTSEITSWLAGGVTTVTDNTMLLYISSGSWGTNTWTPPSGMTERVDDNSGLGSTTGTLHIAELAVAAAGATGDKTATSSDGIKGMCALIALKQAVAGTTPKGPLGNPFFGPFGGPI